MITSITRFPVPPGISPEAVKNDFRHVAPNFKQAPGLVRKYFLLSEDGKTAGGIYLWKTLEQARAFSEGVIRPMLKNKFHLDPAIEYFHSPVIVDNLTSEIIAEEALP